MKAKKVKDKSAEAQSAMMMRKIQGMVDLYNTKFGTGNYTKLNLQSKADRRTQDVAIFNYSQQLTLDVVCIALHEEFGFFEKRQHQLADRIDKVYEELKHVQLLDMGMSEEQIKEIDSGKTLIIEADYKGDPEMLGSIETIERKVKESCGNQYCGRHERYSANGVDFSDLIRCHYL